MTYTPRKVTPSSYDLRWTREDSGGYCKTNFSGSPLAWAGSVLANCTGYVHGRWMEIGGTSIDYDLSTGNASEYWGHSDSYERGQEPRLGAILCLGDGVGHVAIVEEISEDGSYIMCSESNYGGPEFRYVQRDKATGWKMHGGSTVGGFQGFIYHPNPDPEPDYKIIIYKGTASKQTAKEGETVYISALVPKGEHFQRWASNDISLLHPARKETSFLMPAKDVYITAITKKNSKILKGYQVYKGGWI